jgi:hypothetical protein
MSFIFIFISDGTIILVKCIIFGKNTKNRYNIISFASKIMKLSLIKDNKFVNMTCQLTLMLTFCSEKLT